MNKWTDIEIKTLKDNYIYKSDTELQLLLPKHSLSSITTKRKRLGLVREQGNRKYTFTDLKNEIDKRGYELLSNENEYHDVNSKIRYICPTHKDKGELMTMLSSLLRGRGCPYCGIERSAKKNTKILDIDYYKKLCNSHNFKYVKVKRIKENISIEFICNRHPEMGKQFMTVYNMQRNRKGCKYCSGKDIPKWYYYKKIEENNPNIELLEDFQDYNTKVRCMCKIHKIELHKSVKSIIRGRGCDLCRNQKISSASFYSLDEIQKVISKNNNHITIVKYDGAKNNIGCFCNIHKKYFTKGYNTLLYNKSGCDECYKDRMKNDFGMGIEEYKKRLYEKFPQIEVTGEYINNSTPIKMYCKDHNYIFSLSPVAMLNRSSCCNKSMVRTKENQIGELLETWGYNITRQKIFKNCIDKTYLRFDYFLNDFSIAIEYDGEQHYIPVNFGDKNKYDASAKLEYTKQHDKIKDEYCKNNRIKLIRIPYYLFDDVESFLWDELVKAGAIIEL